MKRFFLPSVFFRFCDCGLLRVGRYRVRWLPHKAHKAQNLSGVWKARATQLRIGLYDGRRVRIDSEETMQINADRGYGIDRDITDIRLKNGKNVILMRSIQILDGWASMARRTRPNDTPFGFTFVE